MTRFMYVLVFMLLAGFRQFVSGQAAAEIDVNAFVREALEKNPAILSASERWHAAERVEGSVAAWEDPMVSYTRWLSTPETRVGPQENIFMLSQKIPFPGKLGLMGDMARESAVAERWRFEAVRRDIVFRVKQAYYDLFTVDQSLIVLNDYLSLLKGFNRVAEERYATGLGLQADVLKSQVEISQVLERTVSYKSQRQRLAAVLNSLLNRPEGSPMGIAAWVDTQRVVIPESTLVRIATTERQELLESEAMIRRSSYMASLARKEYLPNFTLQASYVTVGKGNSMAPDAGKDAYSISIGLNLPIQLGKRSSVIEEADARKAASEFQYRNVRNTVSAEILDTYSQVQRAVETLNLYDHGLIIQAETSLESALSAYRTGKMDFLNLLDAQRMLLQVRLGYVREKSNYAKAVAALERSLGGNLPD